MNSKNRETNKLPAPRLRFKQFKGEGEWEEKKLGLLGTFRGGGTPEKSELDYWNGDVPWISSSDISENDIYNISRTRFITEDAIRNSATKKIPAKTVLFVSRVGVGKIAVTDQEVCTSQDFINFTPINDDPYYFAYYFTANKDILVSLGQGMAIKGFTKNDLESFALPLPPTLLEQTHIVAALSSLDAIITAHNHKLDALRQHKRGLMQVLFPAEGERVPRRRFPEFMGNGEWEEKKLREVLTEVVRPIEMTDDQVYSLVTVKRRYGGVIKREDNLGKNILVKTQFSIKADDFLISKRQIVHSACGIVPKDLSGSIVSNEYSVLRTNEGYSIRFFKYFSQQPIVSRSFILSSNGVVIEKMLFNLKDWLHREFLFPTLPEQTRIAACLSSLDDLMTAQTEKIAALQEFKRGLMQGLFPRGGK